MILKIFAVRDSKTAQYGNPMFLISEGHAIRSLADQVNKAEENNILHTHPEDFILFHMGEFNTETGQFNTTPPIQVVTMEQLKIKKQ